MDKLKKTLSGDDDEEQGIVSQVFVIMISEILDPYPK